MINLFNLLQQTKIFFVAAKHLQGDVSVRGLHKRQDEGCPETRKNYLDLKEFIKQRILILDLSQFRFNDPGRL